nr:hypothetical protein [Tanacetum cinerariifolium]
PPLPPPFILSPTRSDAPLSGTPLLLPISAPTSSSPLQLPSASRREDRPEVTLPPRKRLGIAPGPGYEVGESSSAVAARPAGGLRADYGFVATMDREIMRDTEREHVMLSEVRMAMIPIILERVLEGQNKLLVNVLTPTFLSVNHYISKALKELPVFPNGLKEWSLSFISTTTLLKIKSSLLHALFILLL